MAHGLWPGTYRKRGEGFGWSPPSRRRKTRRKFCKLQSSWAKGMEDILPQTVKRRRGGGGGVQGEGLLGWLSAVVIVQDLHGLTCRPL